MNKYINVEDMDELMEEAFEDGMYDTVEEMWDMYIGTCDEVVDLLEEQGMTLSEKSFVLKVLELHSEIYNEKLHAEFFPEEFCDGNCENCSIAY